MTEIEQAVSDHAAFALSHNLQHRPEHNISDVMVDLGRALSDFGKLDVDLATYA